MAAGSMAAPGTDVGPCLEPCEHRDCKAARIVAATACVRCGKPIGYETRFFSDVDPNVIGPQKALAHMVCELEHVDNERRQHAGLPPIDYTQERERRNRAAARATGRGDPT